MLDYDFSKLNDKEFEVFCIDLLSQYLKRRIERFKPGKDAGVDGRYFCTQGKEVIIQCKHWLRTGVEGLIRQLKKEETPKLDKLRPSRYMLVTSLQLSRKNKSDMEAVLSPWLQTSTDIFGHEDLNTILMDHHKVEERHHKLWFSSVSIMSKLHNASIKGRSDFEIEEAQAFASKYVFTSAHADAIEKLEKLGAIIITGEPGIGKSTLAKQIALQYALKDFEICCIARSPEEVEAVWQKNTPQLFYFDDFLGSNYLIALNRHEDSHIVGLLERVRRDPSKRFILTSRTTVLNRGKSLSELFRIKNVDRNEYELHVGRLSLLDKARILYNHLWGSDLPNMHITAIYKDARYLSIAEHQNYNPRLISFITDFNKVGDIPASVYWKYIRDTLQDPKVIWDHVFNNQLSPQARLLVRLTVLNGRQISEVELKDAFERYNPHYGMAIDDTEEFGLAIRLTVGSVLNRHVTTTQTTATYDLFNPSLGDYIINRYKDAKMEIVKCMQALCTTTSLRNLSALVSAKIINSDLFADVIELLAVNSLNEPSFPLVYRIQLALQYSKLTNRRGHPNTTFETFVKFLVRHAGNIEDCQAESELLTLGLEQAVFNDEEHEALLARVGELVGEAWSEDEFQSVSELIDNLPKPELDDHAYKLAKQVEDYWKENIKSDLHSQGILDSYDSLDELEDAQDTMRSYIESKIMEVGTVADYVDTNAIAGRIDLGEIIISNSERRHRGYDVPKIGKVEGSFSDDEVASVHDLFDRNY